MRRQSEGTLCPLTAIFLFLAQDRVRRLGSRDIRHVRPVAIGFGSTPSITMKLSNSSTVPVYTVSGSSTSKPLPEWLERRRKRSFKTDPEYANRVELLQDFEFEEASQCIRISEDGEWVMSTGTYKPQMHTHYLPNLSLSYARHTNTLNKTFLILSSDYSKTVHLQEDRSIEFHRPEGRHHTLRIPRYGRDLVYNRSSAELLVPAVGVNVNGMGEVFRISLDQGRFMKEYEVEVGGDDLLSMGAGALQGGINTGSVNTAAVAEGSHGLMAFGTSIGTVEYWDTRSRSRVALLNMPREYESRAEVTALDFHRSGISMAVGNSAGVIYLYDLRSTNPTLRKDHGYGFPVHTLEYLDMSTSTRNATSEPKVLSCDRRILKIWDERSGDPWTSVEPAVDINSVAWCRDSGMFLTANEGRQQHAFFIPQLGPAPKWCSFLDNVVEEMADDPNDPAAAAFSRQKAGEVYHNHVYLTLPQLQALSLDHLIGKTALLRPYMHGFFIDKQLHDEARLIANPTSYADERAKRVQERIDKERESRIRGKKQSTAIVNRKLAEKLLEREEKNERRRAKRVLDKGGDEDAMDATPAEPTASTHLENGILGDDRFSRLFADEDFAVDETSREFQSLNPSTNVTTGRSSNLDREKGLTAVEEENIDEVPGSSDEDNDSDDSEAAASAFNRKGNSDKISSVDYKRRPLKDRKGGKKMSMSVSSSKSNGNSRQARDRSFGSRAETARPRDRTARTGGGAVGEKVLTFEPTGRKKEAPRYEKQEGSDYKRKSFKDRRSASGNTFRGM
jgi:ribosome biogenesis protein ENP2